MVKNWVKSLVLILFCALFLMSHNVSAFDIVENVKYTDGDTLVYWRTNIDNTYKTGYRTYNAGGTSSRTIQLRSSSNTDIPFSNGDYFVIMGYVNFTGTGYKNTSGFMSIGGDNVSCAILNLQIDDIDRKDGTTNAYQTRVLWTATAKCTESGNNPTIALRFETASASGATAFNASVNNYARYVRVSDSEAVDDIEADTEEMKEQLKQDSNTNKNEKNNISNQNASDIDDGGVGAETQNLFQALRDFVTAFTGLGATNCNMVLEFPELYGGAQTMNLCQGKQYTSNLVSILGSLMLVAFYIPLAVTILRLIFNEVRSYTG